VPRDKIDSGLRSGAACGDQRRGQTGHHGSGELEPATELADALEAQGTEVVAVGDCTGLGLIRKAIEEGARAGASI